MRHASGSQGGCLIIACHARVLTGEQSNCVVVDWKSFLLASSVTKQHCESQAVSAALDAWEDVKCFRALMQQPDASQKDDSTTHLSN